VSRLSRKSGNLNVSQPYGPPWPVAGIALPYLTKSVQALNANSSSLNDMFKAVATIFQQIMTELTGAELEDRIMTITKTALKLMKQNGR
jgi:hypothetical protein